MTFMRTFHWKPDTKTRDEGIARFRKTGGLPPRADVGSGFDLLESDDPQVLAEFALMWSDLIELTISPVQEDEQLSVVLQRIGK